MNLKFLSMKKLTIFLAFLLFVAFQAAAQVQISGTVTGAEDGLSIPGVSIVVKGSPTIGTTTDIDGKYTVTVPGSAEVLIYSFVGMETIEETIGGRSVIDVALSTSAYGLDEIIVSGVASGTPKKKLSVSVSRVGADQLQDVPATSAASALQGKVSGVTVTQSAGNPGRAATIIIRGAKQLVGSQDPLVIVDGVMVDGTLADINVDDIESYEIVKGASASALYGSRAGSGVVVITTKSGKHLKDGEVTVRIRNEYGVNRLAKKYELATHHEYVLADDNDSYDYTKYEGVTYPEDYAGGSDAVLLGGRQLDPDSYMDNPYARLYDQEEEMFKGNSFYTNYVAVEGNSGKTSFLTSFENNSQGGVIDLVDGYKRQNFRINLNQQIYDNLSLSTSNLYIKSETQQPGGESGYNGGIFFNLLLMQPDVDITLENPDGQPYQIVPDPWQPTTTNPLYPLYKNKITDKRDRLISSYALNYNPFEWINFDAKYAFELQNSTYEDYEPYSTWDEAKVYTTGELYEYSSRRFDETAQITANLQKIFGDFTVKGKVSYIYERRYFEMHEATGTDFKFDVERLTAFDNVIGETSADNYKAEEVTKNALGILSLDYKGKYIFDGMYRMDGSSLFGENERWASYYRVSGAWRITEDFEIPGVQELKLRAAYGTSGQRPGFSYQYETMAMESGNASKLTLGNVDLKPARSTEVEVGLNVDFLNKFDFETTYSLTTTEDQFLQAPQPIQTGGWSARWINAGTLESYSIEASLGAQLLEKKDLSWSARLIFDKTGSEITELAVPAFQTGPEGQEADKLFYIREGETLGTMYGYHFLTSLTDMALQLPEGETIDMYEINSDGYVVPAGSQGTIYETPVIEQDETGTNKLVKIGDANAAFNLKLSTNVSYKGFSFYMLWDYKQGGDVYNKTAQWLTRDNRSAMMDQYGKAENEKKTTTYYKTFYAVNEMADYWVEDGTYVKLREVSVYYNLDKKYLDKLGFIKGIKIGLIGRNLLTISDYSGYDPEVQTRTETGSQYFAYDFMGYPNFRSYSGSLEIKF
jgi:TonB-linked SusC/RagA family outer membrane protein